MTIVLFSICGIAWTITYLLIIRRAHIDHFVGMPLLALCANISWEFIFVFIAPLKPDVLLFFTALWFFADVWILILMVYYGPFNTIGKNVLALAIGIVCCSSVILWSLYTAFEPIRSAFGQDLMMSFLFVIMLLRLRSTKGQSLYIALAKGIGTGAAIIIAWNGFPELPIMQIIMGAIICCNTLYIVLLFQQCRKEGINPFMRL